MEGRRAAVKAWGDQPLRLADPDVFGIMEKVKKRQVQGIELIASENFVCKAVMEALGSALTNKYSEGMPGARYYTGVGLSRRNTSIVVVTLDSGEVYIVSSLSCTSDTQVIYIDPTTGALRYRGRTGYDLFNSEAEALKHITDGSRSNRLPARAILGCIWNPEQPRSLTFSGDL